MPASLRSPRRIISSTPCMEVGCMGLMLVAFWGEIQCSCIGEERGSRSEEQRPHEVPLTRPSLTETINWQFCVILKRTKKKSVCCLSSKQIQGTVVFRREMNIIIIIKWTLVSTVRQKDYGLELERKKKIAKIKFNKSDYIQVKFSL